MNAQTATSEMEQGAELKQIGAHGGFFPRPNAKVLAVLLHAYTHTPTSLDAVAREVRSSYPDSDLLIPRLPVGAFSWADSQEIADQLVARIDALETKRRETTQGVGYHEIILAGHSLGAVLARKVWALAQGATPAATVDQAEVRPWAGKIRRVILLAAMNRGWMISSALTTLARLEWTLGTAWGNFCRHVLRHDPLIFGIRRGAPFLTTTRLQCLAVERSLVRRGGPLPITVQLLGTADDYVAPTDNLDLATGPDFHYLEVEEGTHRGIVTLKEGGPQAGALARFRSALQDAPDVLRRRALAREDVFDLYEVAADDHDATSVAVESEAVKQVVFVIHGIRDKGFWTRRIARRIKEASRAAGKPCRSVTSTYGYFPMGPFLVPWKRRVHVEWLLDQYVTAKALYPDAAFAYVGHSNGTYLLAQALELCPAIRFQHVVFAGSVVRSNYDWRRFLSEGRNQVERVLNYVGADDRVVAIFPHGLERLRLQDLGGAGHLGFAEIAAAGHAASRNVESLGKPLVNVKYVSGGHSGALKSDSWDDIAAFVVSGTAPPASGKPDKLTKWLGALSPLIWTVILLVVLGLTSFVLAPLGFPVPNILKLGLTDWASLDRLAREGGVVELLRPVQWNWAGATPGWIIALLFVLYLRLLSVIVTKS
jgi:pimeloyl-ACP methyl ester carboxylesterase